MKRIILVIVAAMFLFIACNNKNVDLYGTPHKEAAEVYDTHSALSPDGRHLAMAMMYLNQMNFISLTDFGRSSTSLYCDSKICDDESKKIFYYRGIAANDRYVCGLYSNTLLMGAARNRRIRRYMCLTGKETLRQNLSQMIYCMQLR